MSYAAVHSGGGSLARFTVACVEQNSRRRIRFYFMFVVFEGGDGAGKTTQAQILAQRCQAMKKEVVVLPRVITTTQFDNPVCEVLLLALTCTQYVDDVIRPALDRGAIVIGDRFVDSLFAYSLCGRGISSHDIQLLNSLITRGVEPNVTILLDVAPSVGLARYGDVDPHALEFHERVRREYLNRAAQDRRWVVIDGHKDSKEVADVVWAHVEPYIA